MPPPPVVVHVAGPVEANGEQRCLGCDLLLHRGGDHSQFFRFGARIGFSRSPETGQIAYHPIHRNRRKLRDNETPCHRLRRRDRVVAAGAAVVAE